MKTSIFKKALITLSMVFALSTVYSPVVEAKPVSGTTPTVTATTAVKPVFSSSFIQSWYADEWTPERWTSELQMLKQVGITEVIIQNTVDTKAKIATYPTTMQGYASNPIDLIGTALTAADALGMKVRIGLCDNDDWWNKNASDVSWLNAEAAANKAVFNEIITKYGNHPSLGGWYLSYEFSQFTARTTTTQTNLRNFFTQIASEIKAKDSGRNVMIAPFYNGKYSWMTSFSSWSTMVKNILTGTKIDIVALQDSVGAGYNTTTQLTSLYSYTKKATDALGIKLYADTETFTSTSTGNVPADQTRISKQLSIEKAYVQGFVAFSIDHFQNKNNPDQVKGYDAYYNYYLANK